MYSGPVIDAFCHPAWSNGEKKQFGDREAWLNDPMRARVMRTFRHEVRDEGEPDEPLSSAERTLLAMDASGVEKALLQASLHYPSSWEELERCVLEHVDLILGHPTRFAHCGTVRPPMQGPASYWDLLENPRIVAAHQSQYQISGIHLLPAPWGTPPNDRWYYPLYAKCVELGLVVFTYVGMPGPLWPTWPNYPLHLDEVCLAFPELVVVAHHIGDPWVEMMTYLAGKHPNLYIATSGWAPKRYPAELLAFMRGKWHGQEGADKVIFGTDYPFLKLEKTVNDARNLDLPNEVLTKFLYDNVRKLLPALSTNAGQRLE